MEEVCGKSIILLTLLLNDTEDIMKQLHHRFCFGILGILTTLMIACGGGGGGGGSSQPPAPPAPIATSLTAGAASISPGDSTTLTPVFSNGTGVITPGNIPATSGTAIPVSPTTTTTYTLTVTNSVGLTAIATATITVISTTKTLSYVDPTSGTYRWIKNSSLSTSSLLVLDLVTTDSQLLSGIAFTMTTDPTKAGWSKVNSSDNMFVQNGTVFNIGASTPIFYSNQASSNATLTAVIAQKGASGIPVNGSSAVLARIALLANNSGTAGTINLTPIRAQVNVQGISNPSNITITAGTLTLN
jgi:hypothetical protein